MITFQPITITRTAIRCLRQAMLFAVLLPAVVLLAVPTASAQDGTGETIVDVCMDDLFPGNLGCTANDVRVSGVADVTNDGLVNEDDITFAPVCDAGASNAGDDCSADPNICMDSNGNDAPMLCGDACAYLGDTTKFAATFEVVLGAQARYDIGMYFAIDGDPNGDGALTGTCSISTLPEVGSFMRPDGSTGDFVDLDTNCKGGNCPQPQDLCGDIDADNSPIFYDISDAGQGLQFITAECVDPDGNGQLNLPNCTSWRQSGANEVCLSPTDAFPGSPSKCNCDPGFEVPINVPPAELQVVKTATPTLVNEPGGTVKFDVAVTNTGIDPFNNVTLESLTDVPYGDITQVQGDILSTTCSVPQTLTPDGGAYTCSFNATVSGNGGDSKTDIVTAAGVDDNGNGISGSDDATVDIVDVLPAISVVKTADPTTVLEGAGESVTFTVVVDNDSVADALTLTSLEDDIHGDLNGQGTCATGGTIALGGSYTCSFSAVVDGQAFTDETDTVTAVGVDDEFVDDETTMSNKVSASDSATVTILDDEAMIELIKKVNGQDSISVNEPGEEVTFTFTVNNLSSVDTVTIQNDPAGSPEGTKGLSDSIYGDLHGQGDCSVPQVLAPLGTYDCSITVFVGGDAEAAIMNVATAEGEDDDGQRVMDSDDATVNILDVPPAASLTKTATMVIATFEVVVTNDSAAESLDLTVLDDDKFGDITQVQGNVQSTNCLDQGSETIAIGGSYTCSFDGKINVGDLVDGAHTDTVTGTVSDDDGGSVTPSDSATVTF